MDNNLHVHNSLQWSQGVTEQFQRLPTAYLHPGRFAVPVCSRVVATLDITVFAILPDHQNAAIHPAAILGVACFCRLHGNTSSIRYG